MTIRRLPGGVGFVRIDVGSGEDLLLAMKTGYVTRVGILGSSASRMAADEKTSKNGRTRHVINKAKDADLTNAEIGLKHEKGSLSEHIPRRSFLEVPLVQHSQELAGPRNNLIKWIRKATDEGANDKACWKAAHKDLGMLAEQIVQRAFETGGYGAWPENSPMTIALKGSDRPLIDTGQLRRSIVSAVIET